MNDPASTSASARPQRRRPRKDSQAGTGLAAQDQTQPWTATRCLRLLRPLLAHIAVLRKDKERRDLLKAAQSARTGATQPAKQRKRSYPGSDSDYGDKKKPCRKYSRRGGRGRRQSTADEATTPQPAQRRRLQQGHRSPQDIVVSTPFLRRVHRNQPSSPVQAPEERPQVNEPPTGLTRCTHYKCHTISKCAYELDMGIWVRTRVDSERYGLYVSVFRAFDAILRATDLPQRRSWTTRAGPSSLLAMCLRKMPEYIAGVEEWVRQQSEENGTKTAIQGAGATFDIYSDLESLGTLNGWRHLCLLLRAHAMNIIQTAVADGLFEDSMTDILIKVCGEYMPPSEIYGLVKVFCTRQYPKPRPGDESFFGSASLNPLCILPSLETDKHFFTQRIFAHLLADGLLPTEWLLNGTFLSYWPNYIRPLTRERPCQDVMDFASVTLELLCGFATLRRPRGVSQARLQKGPQTALISAIGVLGSLVLLSQVDSPSTTTDTASRGDVLRQRVKTIVTTCLANLKRTKSPGLKLGSYILNLLAHFVIDSSGQTPFANYLEEAWRLPENDEPPRSDRDPTLPFLNNINVAFASTMAYHCSRVTGLRPHVHLDQLCDRLEAAGALPHIAVHALRVMGSFRVAELTGDLRDLGVAEERMYRANAELDILMAWNKTRKEAEPAARAESGIATTTPKRAGRISGSGTDTEAQKATVGGVKKKKAAAFMGVRWDDGISEWVAATPASEARPRGRRGLRSRGRVESQDDSDREEEEDEDMTDEQDESEPALKSMSASTAKFSGERGDSDETDVSSGSDMDTLLPNTDVSPQPTTHARSNPSSSKAVRRRPLSRPQEEVEAAESDGDGDDENDETTTQPRRRKSQHNIRSSSAPRSTATPKHLHSRPRRLSRRLALAIPDELTLDDSPSHISSNGEAEKESQSWLIGKKPARFRLRGKADDGPANNYQNNNINNNTASGSTTPRSSSTTNSNSNTNGNSTGQVRKKRLARPSLVSLTSAGKASSSSTQRLAVRSSVGNATDGRNYDYDVDSGDELSFL